MNQYFSVGEAVIRKKTGSEHVIAEVVTEPTYRCPATGNGYVWNDSDFTTPGYRLDMLAYDDGQLKVFHQRAIIKKNDPAEESFTEDFTTLMDKLNQPVTA